MKKFKYLQRIAYLIIFTLFSFLVSSLYSRHVFGQSTWQEVYTIFQSIGTIDSVDFAAMPMADAYDSIFDHSTANTFAQSKAYKRIDPGHPHSSFLFRKINDGLDADIVLDPGEGGNAAILSNENKELIRQWILWGAPETGVVVDTALIYDYYNGNGLSTVPNPPAAPDPADGFQIHFGPYFVPPFSELEYFLKLDPHLADTIEIYRTDVFMGDNYSHHFILYRIENDASATPEGLRPGHTTDPTAFVTGAQFTDSVFLPAKTAFVWPQAALLDLNSHHINITPSVMGAEVYINIYTQPKGTAKQIMHTDLVLGAFPFALVILNDGSTYTFEDSFIPQNDGLNDIFVWGMTSHTHQWGVDFDIYKRNPDGTKGEHYFDGSNLYGHPDCLYLGYDYDRPPGINFEPFLFVPKNEGLIQVASYVNTGPNNPVTWGITSEDEMMIMVLLYVKDTTGLSPPLNNAPVTMADAATTDSAVAVVIDVQANDNDPDGDPLTTTICSNPNNGIASVINDTSIQYTPNSGFTGTDSLIYVVWDNGKPLSYSMAKVIITVTSPLVGINDNVLNSQLIRIFPNPFSDKTILFLPQNDPGLSFTLYDVLGAKVKQIDGINSQQIIIKRNNLSSGVYFYQVSRKNEVIGRGKLIVSEF